MATAGLCANQREVGGSRASIAVATGKMSPIKLPALPLITPSPSEEPSMELTSANPTISATTTVTQPTTTSSRPNDFRLNIATAPTPSTTAITSDSTPDTMAQV